MIQGNIPKWFRVPSAIMAVLLLLSTFPSVMYATVDFTPISMVVKTDFGDSDIGPNGIIPELTPHLGLVCRMYIEHSPGGLSAADLAMEFDANIFDAANIEQDIVWDSRYNEANFVKRTTVSDVGNGKIRIFFSVEGCIVCRPYSTD